MILSTHGILKPTSVLVNTRSMDFDGVDEYARVTSAAALNPAGNFSWTFWIKFTANPVNFDGVLDKYVGGTSGYFFDTNLARQVRFNIFTTVDREARITTAPSNNVWFHIAGTYDGTNVRIYYEGALEATSAATSGAVTGNSHDLFFNGDGVSTLFSPIRLDQIRYYSKALSLAEVAEDRTTDDARTTSMSGNLVAYWPIGEGTGDDATGTTGVLKDIKGGFNATPFNTEAGDLVNDVHV